jgi:Serine phosphatase RsbU, regulator of sigma subunit
VTILDPETEINTPSLNSPDSENAIILLPIIAHDEVLGALLVSYSSGAESSHPSRFSDHTRAILQGVTQQTAVALENIRLVETRQEEAYITAVLLQIAQAVVTQNNLNDILDSIIQLMPILVGVQTSVIYLWDKVNEQFLPAQSIAQSRELREWLKKTTYPVNTYHLLDGVRQEQKMGICRLPAAQTPSENWPSIACVCSQEKQLEIVQENGYWLLGFPLNVKSEFYGVLVTCENEAPSPFPQKRIELLNGVAQQISLAIQDDRLNQEMLGRERIEQEIQLARQIQKNFLPEKLPRVKGWNLDLRWNTAREVGGDFYDVFAAHSHKLAFAIADVSDKGIPAALYMTVTRTLIHSGAQTLHSPAKVLEQVNKQLMTDSQSGMFITAVFGLLDPITGKVEFAIAGHNLPLIYRAGSQTIDCLPKDGMALGVLEKAGYHDQSVLLEPGDILLLYTDGVTETFSPEGEIFGEERLRKEFLEASLHHPEDVLETLYEKIKQFRGSDVLSDDLTMLSFQRKK